MVLILRTRSSTSRLKIIVTESERLEDILGQMCLVELYRCSHLVDGVTGAVVADFVVFET